MPIDGTLIEAHDVLRQGASFIAEYVLNLKDVSTSKSQNHTQTISQRKALRVVLFDIWIIIEPEEVIHNSNTLSY